MSAKTVYLSLGANVGDRAAALQRAIEELSAPDFRITAVSSVYETEPQGFTAQPWFLNAVVQATTDSYPMVLLHRIQAIERRMGRRRTVPKGPRAIDIDILLFGNFVVETAELRIPHPGLVERRFVLEPLCELAPELRHPENRRTMRELLAGVAGQRVKKTSFTLRLSAIGL
jgi:2-amino-4-hydroxy-6-hydroxymethyldihydropteridine diphosphokinase